MYHFSSFLIMTNHDTHFPFFGAYVNCQGLNGQCIPLKSEALLASVVANEEDREDEEDDAIGWAAKVNTLTTVDSYYTWELLIKNIRNHKSWNHGCVFVFWRFMAFDPWNLF